MIRLFLATALAIAALPSQAQPIAQDGGKHGRTNTSSAMNGAHLQHVGASPREPGQSAFAAIQEIVALLDADPLTEWSTVDIAALRNHLVDMSNVTLLAQVHSVPLDDGYRFVVTGQGDVIDSIRRMVQAHAATMGGIRGFRYETELSPSGAVMTVRVGQPSDLEVLGGLGFIGVMTLGAHHQEHHLSIATGHAPHN